ncbi:hypothetical protein Scep_026144 [Stephania cephalantha]|uniref:C2 tensin-type domain-containing protein n=1 Tax=Stephania cephalantha TaxID=152367 RepID=A0AAP0EJK0_9MAGN
MGGSFDGEESPSPASRAASRDDYTTIFYPPTSKAVGGAFCPSTFLMTELEYINWTQSDPTGSEAQTQLDRILRRARATRYWVTTSEIMEPARVCDVSMGSLHGLKWHLHPFLKDIRAKCELVKIDIHCPTQGDVVLKCITLDEDLEREEMMFRVMFNTSFIKSNILMLNRYEIDILWDAKDRFPKDLRSESPISYGNSPLGSPMSMSRYHNAPLPLGIAALLHDHASYASAVVNRHVLYASIMIIALPTQPPQCFRGKDKLLKLPRGYNGVRVKGDGVEPRTKYGKHKCSPSLTSWPCMHDARHDFRLTERA